MRVLVFGGRRYDNRALVCKVLDEIHAVTPITLLIQGEAPGADRLGKQWAIDRKVSPDDYHADWNDLQAEIVIARQRADGSWYNAAAGKIRNKLMLDKGKPDLAIGFPGNGGTKDMTSRIKREKKYRPELRYMRVDHDGFTVTT